MKKIKKTTKKVKGLSQKEQILKKLKSRKNGVKQTDFQFKISLRICELIKDGHKITREKNKNGFVIYKIA